MVTSTLADFFTRGLLPLIVILAASLTYSRHFEDRIASNIRKKHRELRNVNPTNDSLSKKGREVFRAHLYHILFKKSYQLAIAAVVIWNVSLLLEYASEAGLLTLPDSPLGIGAITAIKGLSFFAFLIAAAAATPVLYSFGISTGIFE